jgi:diguanylate cyclase (GGDEF)-like protein/PAS domain S-box-containing protein
MPPSPPAHSDTLPTDPFRGAFERALLPLWITDMDQRYIEVNDALCRMLGQPREKLLGARHQDFTHVDERELDAEELGLVLSGARDAFLRETRMVRADGSAIWVVVAMAVIADENGEPSQLAGQAHDVTARRQHEQRLRHLADHDPLTGLLNRRGFDRELRRHVSRIARYGMKGALLMLDLDDFKGFNDTHGHAGGDELLRSIGGVLGGRLRSGDVVGRIGGDEFAVLLPEATPEQASAVADALVHSVREADNGQGRHATASIGVFCFDDTQSVSENGAMVNADIAMYAAKHAGRDGYVPFEADDVAELDQARA